MRWNEAKVPSNYEKQARGYYGLPTPPHTVRVPELQSRIDLLITLLESVARDAHAEAFEEAALLLRRRKETYIPLSVERETFAMAVAIIREAGTEPGGET